jgi:UDP-N-acetylmuramate--alanine ligase
MNTQPHLYLVGIAGVGMVWIADYALAQGWQVSGSELAESATTKRLQAAGANIHIGCDADKIPTDITEAIITSAITATSPSFAEYEALQKRQISMLKRAEWVGKMTKQKRTIAVAGTHGKTTTTAMIGWILQQAGLDPTVFVGGALTAWDSVTLIGKSEFLVLEADEYDRSFHQFFPEIAVLLNIDLDHTDYYTKGLPEVEHSFKRFLRNLVHRHGMVVAYGRDKSIRKIVRGFKFRFRWYDEKNLWPGLKLLQPGMHYLLNATAAARVAHELGVGQKVIRKALATFPGVQRRLEMVGQWNQVEWIDDYAHHPREISATLAGLKERYGVRRLTVVFQPHQKARTEELLEEFGRCFDVATPDELILAPIYQVAGRENDSAISSADIATEIAKKTPARMTVQVATTSEELENMVKKVTETSGIMVSMGAGDIRARMEGWR